MFIEVKVLTGIPVEKLPQLIPPSVDLNTLPAEVANKTDGLVLDISISLTALVPLTLFKDNGAHEAPLLTVI